VGLPQERLTLIYRGMYTRASRRDTVWMTTEMSTQRRAWMDSFRPELSGSAEGLPSCHRADTRADREHTGVGRRRPR
jgi:hypothetical protein